MTAYIDIYNNLPPVFEADRRFVERENTLTKLAPLLAKYDNRYAVCLVHAHCKIEPGERMIATGNITQPEDTDSFPSPYYPERWLSTGEAFEFTTSPTSIPPAQLFNEFHEIARDIGVLGLCYVGSETRVGSWIERTEGRRNIMEPESEAAPPCCEEENITIQTAFYPSTVGGVVVNSGPKPCCKHCKHCRGHC